MERKAPTNEQASGLGRIAISGDPLQSRILALLLRDSDYQAEYMPISSLHEPKALEDVQLFVLAPTQALLSIEEHKALLASLRKMTRDRALIVVELISLSEERRAEEEARELPSHKVLWPCGIDELEQRIESALRTATR